jgi:hypothetical protein
MDNWTSENVRADFVASVVLEHLSFVFKVPVNMRSTGLKPRGMN